MIRRAIRDILIAIGAFVGSQVIIVAILATLGFSSEAEMIAKTTEVSVVYIIGGLSLIASLGVLMRLSSISLKELNLKKPSMGDVLYTVLGYGLYVVILLVVLSFVRILFPQLDWDQTQQLGLSTSISGLTLVLVFVALVVVTPLAEEILFRGFIYSRLRHYGVGVVVSAVLTSVLFGLVHQQWNVALDTFLLSLVMIYVMEFRKRNLWVAIGMHSIKNCIAFLGLFVFKLL